MIVKMKPYDGSFSALITREVAPRHLQAFTTTNLHQNTFKQQTYTTIPSPHQTYITTLPNMKNSNKFEESFISSLFASSSSPVLGGLGVGQEMKVGAEMYRQLNTLRRHKWKAVICLGAELLPHYFLSSCFWSISCSTMQLHLFQVLLPSTCNS